MKPPALHIPVRIAGIPDGISEFRVDVQPAEIGLPEEFRDPVAVDVRMDKSHAHILLEVKAAADAHYPCDRCLEDLTLPMEAAFSLLYARDAAASNMAGDEEVRILQHDTTFVDIGDDVRDFLLLGIPMRRVCAEYDGDPACGSSIPTADTGEVFEDIDPRWEGLKSISKQ